MWIDEFDLLHRAAVAAKVRVAFSHVLPLKRPCQATESKRVSAYNKQIQAASLHRKEETARRKKAEAKAKRDKATEEDKVKEGAPFSNPLPTQVHVWPFVFAIGF